MEEEISLEDKLSSLVYREKIQKIEVEVNDVPGYKIAKIAMEGALYITALVITNNYFTPTEFHIEIAGSRPEVRTESELIYPEQGDTDPGESSSILEESIAIAKLKRLLEM